MDCFLNALFYQGCDSDSRPVSHILLDIKIISELWITFWLFYNIIKRLSD